jgi:hypothetical protein
MSGCPLTHAHTFRSLDYIQPVAGTCLGSPQDTFPFGTPLASQLKEEPALECLAARF